MFLLTTKDRIDAACLPSQNGTGLQTPQVGILERDFLVRFVGVSHIFFTPAIGTVPDNTQRKVLGFSLYGDEKLIHTIVSSKSF